MNRGRHYLRLRNRWRRRRRRPIGMERCELVQLWTLRALLHSGGLLGEHGAYCQDEVARGAGLPELLEDTYQEDLRARTKLVKARIERLEASVQDREGALFASVDRIGRLLGLSSVEQDLLALGVLIQGEPGIHQCCSNTEHWSVPKVQRFLAQVLDRPEPEVRQALSATGTFRSTGLLRVGARMQGYTTDLVSLMEGLTTVLLTEHDSDDSLLSCFFAPARPARLRRRDFAHLEPQLGLLRKLLHASLKRREKGVNVLVHGAPGVGKSELARTLGETLGAAIVEVRSDDAEGEPLGSQGRMAAYLLAQQLVSRSEATLVLFDEVEDVFGSGIFTRDRQWVGGQSKGFVNRILEENPVPAIWICNQHSDMDLAFVRRFDLVLEMKSPPRETRARILRERCRGLRVRSPWIRRMAAVKAVTPADVEAAVRVIKLAGVRGGGAAEEALERVLEARLEARNLKLKAPEELCADPDYDRAFIRADVDPDRLLTGLRASGSGRICFNGPPGTGKTAFARHLAAELDKPLHARRASDLLDKYVGGTEGNLAAMFREASQREAILLLDEADSFLQDRGRALRSWEVSHVNELLVQMEQFDGIFLCSTNLIDTFDRAAFRRFDIKVQFDYLTADQRWSLFGRVVARLDGALPDSADARARLRRNLDTLPRLTPGDFAAVRRRLRILGGAVTPQAIIDALEADAGFQPGVPSRAVGFRG